MAITLPIIYITNWVRVPLAIAMIANSFVGPFAHSYERKIKYVVLTFDWRSGICAYTLYWSFELFYYCIL